MNRKILIFVIFIVVAMIMVVVFLSTKVTKEYLLESEEIKKNSTESQFF